MFYRRLSSNENFELASRHTPVIRGGRLTKWKGRVASYSPTLGAVMASVSPTSLGTAAIVAVPMLLGGANSALANCIDEGGGVFTCSTPSNTEQDLNAAAVLLDVNVAPLVNFDTAGNGTDAFDLDGDSGIDFTQAPPGGVIRADADAINATNLTSGDLSITTTGVVEGDADGDGTGTGIRASNGMGAGSLTINVGGTVSGGDYAIFATNSGDGALTITTSGNVTGDTDGDGDGSGIGAIGNGTDLIIDAQGDVIGGNYGITANNNGSGTLSITTAGIVTGTNSMGINATNSTNGTSLTINAQDDVSGNEEGIYAYNHGSGSLSVTAMGSVTGGSDYDGIEARVDGGTDLTVEAQSDVLGGENGIYAINDGSGLLSITVAGDITGDTDLDGDGSGIIALNYGTDLTVDVQGAVEGGNQGIDVFNQGSGAVSITTSGPVIGGANNGINAYNSTNGTSLTINAAGDVTAGEYGVSATNRGSGSLSIVVTGSVTAGEDGTGIDAQNDGTDLTINVQGDVTALYNGIYAENLGSGLLSITTVGDVIVDADAGGYGTGLNVRNIGTSLTIDSVGNISGAEDGIEAGNYGSGALSITVVGDVTGDTDGDGEGYGISAENTGTDLTINIQGNVMGGGEGIYAGNEGTGALFISTTGDITGDTDGNGYGSGISANNEEGTSLTILSQGNVSGGQDGIYVEHFGSDALSITVIGDVTGDTDGDGRGYGIDADNYGTDLIIDVQGNVIGGEDGIYAGNNGTGVLSITATGTTTGLGLGPGFGGGNGIAADNDGTDLLIMTGTVNGADEGINADNDGTGALSITTTGNVTGDTDGNGQGYGIYAYNSGTDLTINVQGDVTGAEYGVYANNGGTGALSITVTGTTTANAVMPPYGGGFGIYAATDGTDISILAGNVNGTYTGIRAESNGSEGISITTTGTVRGDTDGDGTGDGISADNDNGGSITIDAQGDVLGGGHGIQAGSTGAGGVLIQVSGNVTGDADGDGYGNGITAYNNAGYAGYPADPNNLISISQSADTTTSGAVHGIEADNAGNSLTIAALGTSVGTTGNGINAVNQSTGTDLTITAYNVRGGVDGINARNYGTGILSITTTGNVVGDTDGDGDGYGIYATNYGVDLAIQTQGDVSGGKDGIRANNYGSGALSITVSGDVTGALKGIKSINTGSGDLTIVSTGTVTGYGGNGIEAVHASYDGALNIDVENVSGLNSGIYARTRYSRSGGDVTISTTGVVTSAEERGIDVKLYDDGGSLSIQAYEVSGETYGIYAKNYGNGDLTISTTGMVEGRNSRGIEARLYDNNGGGGLTIHTNEVSGGTDGILARNYGSESLTVSVSGDITGKMGDGINANNLPSGLGSSLVINQAEGTTTRGENNGIIAVNYSGPLIINAEGTSVGVQNSGIQAGTTGDATDLIITAQSATGGISGIAAFNRGLGAASITVSGDVVGDTDGDGLGDGINVYNYGTSLTIDAQQNVSGAARGIRARNYGSGGLTIRMAGDVISNGGRSGVSDGVEAYNSANDISASMYIYQASGATIIGVVNGANANNAGGSLAITALGTSVGTNGNGINAINQATGTDLTITANNVQGGVDGINTRNDGSGEQTITISGAVSGTTGVGLNTYTALGSMTAITLEAGASVNGGSGVAIANNEGDSNIVVNAGAIIVGKVRLGDGSDNLSIIGADVSQITLLDGGDDADGADGFIDELTFSGAIGTIDAHNLINWEVISFVDGDITIDDFDRQAFNVCGGSGTLGGASMVDDALGCIANDEITITDNSIVADSLEGAGGADVLSVMGDASVGSVFGGGAGQDDSAADDTGDTILIDTTGTVGLIDGGLGDDTIALSGGTITTVVFGGEGNDDLLLDGASVTDAIGGGAGDDSFTWSAGAVGSFTGGDGSDNAVVTAAEYDGSQVLDGGDDTSAADGFVDTLTLAGMTLTGANIINWENVIIDGGVVSFADNALAVGSDADTGLMLTNEALLDAGTAFALTGNLNIDAGSIFDGTGGGNGAYAISGSVANNGLIDMQDDALGDTLAVNGDYAGTGALQLDVDIVSGDGDQVIVGGDVTGGQTTIIVNDLSDGTATGEDVLLVDVGGTSVDDAFVLAGGPILSGAFSYELEERDEDWVLAGNFSPSTPAYEVLPQGMMALNRLSSLKQRAGNRVWQGAGTQSSQGYGARGATAGSSGIESTGLQTGVWGNVQGAYADVDPARTTTGVDYDIGQWEIQLGADVAFSDSAGGILIGGIMAHYSMASLDVNALPGSGDVDVDGYGVGATLTWYGAGGFYTDGQVQVTWFDTDIASNTLGDLSDDADGFGYAFSVEVGQTFETDGAWTLTPQAQLSYADVDFDTFTGPVGEVVSLEDGDSLLGRLGLSIDRRDTTTNAKGTTDRTHFYGIVNLTYEFLDGSEVLVSGVSFINREERLMGELGVGGALSWDDDRYALYGEVAVATSLSNFGDSYRVQGNVGFRVKW